MSQVKEIPASGSEKPMPMGVYMTGEGEKESELSQLLALIADNEKLSPLTLFLIAEKFPALADEVKEMLQSVDVENADSGTSTH